MPVPLGSSRVLWVDDDGGVKRLSAVLLLAACGREPPVPEEPRLAAHHQAMIRELVDRVVGEQYELASPSRFRFAEPVRDRVASWHWEEKEDGKTHAFGYRHGWRVDFWWTPDYEDYPEQPESCRMAFFGEGRLRGIFVEGSRAAPLELDRWDSLWVDPTWPPRAARGAPPK